MMMAEPIQPFRLERYFARYEFKARYLLSPSDCESLSLKDVLALADPPLRGQWDNLGLGYTESAGHPELRSEVSRLYFTASMDDILVLAPEEGIYIAMRTLLSPGDEVIALTPCYQSLAEVARSAGCRVIEWPLLAQDGRWVLSIDRLRSLITSKTRMLVVNFPHNPTGYLPGAAEFQALVEIARQHGLWLFSDEMYRFLEHDPTHRLAAAVDLYEKGVSLGGMSKAFSLPGLRIGWLASKSRAAMQSFIEYKDYTTICSSAPSELLAIMALRARDAILDSNLAIIRRNLRAAQAFIAGYEGLFRWYPPLGGSIAFPEWTGPLDLERVCLDLVNDFGVMVVPGSYFNGPGSHFRLGLGRQNLPEALDQVSAYIRQTTGLDQKRH